MVGSLLGLLQPGKVMWLQSDPRLANQSQQQKNSLMQAWQGGWVLSGINSEIKMLILRIGSEMESYGRLVFSDRWWKFCRHFLVFMFDIS
jgi:hypothetical protein